MNKIRSSAVDHLINRFDMALRTSFAPSAATPRQHPAESIAEVQLSAEEKNISSGLMRINHTGEVCAQALYAGQAAAAKDPHVATKMELAAKEEADHLYWCEHRLNELNTHTSILNPLWYASSWLVGAAAGAIGDRWSLGFVIETENQVEAHLQEHLEKLPKNDNKSRAIVTQMQKDEIKHAQMAQQAGGVELPAPVRFTMKFLADTMKAIVYRV